MSPSPSILEMAQNIPLPASPRLSPEARHATFSPTSGFFALSEATASEGRGRQTATRRSVSSQDTLRVETSRQETGHAAHFSLTQPSPSLSRGSMLPWGSSGVPSHANSEIEVNLSSQSTSAAPSRVSSPSPQLPEQRVPEFAEAELQARRNRFGWPGHQVRHCPVDAEAGLANIATFPPPDLDEAAGFLGRIEGLGLLLQRLVMGTGGVYALYAAWQGIYSLQEDHQAIRALATNEGNAARPKPKRMWEQEAQDRRFSWWSNLVLTPGSALMGINLLFAPELLGRFSACLVGISEHAMLPAVGFMAVYGGLVAVKAGLDYFRARKAKTQLVKAFEAETSDAQAAASARQIASARKSLTRRLLSTQRHDLGLIVSGLAQAVGAVAMYAFGPAWLLVLLPGTLALGGLKYSRMRLVGQWPVSETQTLIDKGRDPQALVPQSQGQNISALASASEAFQELQTASAQDMLWFEKITDKLWSDPFFSVPSNTTAAAEVGTRQVEGLARFMQNHGLFVAFAERVANDKLIPPLVHAGTEGQIWRLSGSDLVNLVAPTSQEDDRSDVVQRLNEVALEVTRPALGHQLQQRRAFLEDLFVASLA